MRIPIADHVRTIPKSGIRDFFEIVQSMEHVISLGIGEPDFVTPWHIREAAIYSLEQGRTGYTSNLGHPRLRKAVSDYIRRNFGIPYDPRSEILITVGVSEAIDLALRAMLNPGDEVIYHEPCYVSYAPSIQLAFGKAVPVATRFGDGFSLRAVDLEKALTPKSRALLLNFPTNPTGGTMDREELANVALLCEENDLVVIADEIYSELTYDEHERVSIASFPGMRERTVFLHGLSKAFAMTGWRLGYACAPAPFIEAMMKIHQYAVMCVPTMTQDAAVEALDRGAEDVRRMKREYELRRNYIVRALNEAGLECLKPKGSFYVFPSIASTGLSSHEFSMRLLREKSVAVVPGTAFGPGGEGHIRCSFATGFDELKEACRLISEFVKEVPRSSSRSAA